MGRPGLVEALVHHPELHDTLLQALADLGVGVVISDGHDLVRVNDASLALPPQVLDRVKDIVRDARRDGNESRHEVRAIDGAGRRVRVEVSARGADDGSLVIAVVHDVTQSRLAYQRERKRAEQLAALAEVAQGLTGTLDPDELLLAIADAARTVIGAGAAVLSLLDDKGAIDRLIPVGLSADDAVALARRPAGIGVLIVPIVRGGRTLGRLHLAPEHGAAAFDAEDEAVAMSLAAHAAETIEVARAFQHERQVARELQALDEMKNAFLSAVSHELRTPLTIVVGLAQTLQRPELQLDADQQRDFLQRLARNAWKLQRLLSDLLDLDRLRRGILEPRRRPTQLDALVARVVKESGLADERTTTLDLEPLEVAVDCAQVERIVENLVINALRHTNPGTPVWVGLRSCDGGVLLSVDDGGAGVPRDLQAVIFEPFRQGANGDHSPGVGVGLSLVARFAELHGGRAWVEDRDGGGASFRVFLAAPAT